MLRRSGLVAAIATTLAAVSASSASADGTWSATGPLPAGSAATTYAQVLSPPGGGTLLWQWQSNRPVLVPISPAGALGTPQPFPTDANNGASGKPVHAYFLPNGDALFSYEPFNSSALHLVYRFANGTFGPVFRAPSTPALRALAVRSGQVLLVEDSEGANPILSAHTLSIGLDGSLTANADTVPIYTSTGSTINYVGAAISADGSADVVAFVDHISTTGNEVVDVQRAPDAAGGGWSPARSLSASVDPEHVAGRGSTFPGSDGGATDAMAVAPGGRAILEFEAGTLNAGRSVATSGNVFALVREPGGTFGQPQLTSATPPNRAGGVYSYVQVAAGGDGTLAIASNFMSCADSNFTTLSYTPVVASVAAPGGGLAAVPVPGGDSTTQTRVTPTSLGAGAGRAIVGLTTKTNTGSVLPLNGCGLYSTAGQSGTLGDGAVITGGPDGTDVATFANLPWPEGRPPVVRVDAAGLDAAGNAAVAGSLATVRGIEYAAFAARPRPRSSGPEPGPGPGPGARTAVSFGSPSISADSLTVRVTCTGPAGTSCTGTATLTVKEILVAGRVKAVSAKAKPRRSRRRTKTVTIGKATFRIVAGKSTRVTVSLNSAGKALHKKFAKLPATLTIRVSGTTKTSHVRFPRPPPRKKPAKRK